MQSYDVVNGRNELVAKVIFLHLSVILFTGGGLPQCMLGCPPCQGDPPEGGTPLPRRPPCQGDPPPRRPPCQGDPPGRRPPRHTVNERSVHILLECILVYT